MAKSRCQPTTGTTDLERWRKTDRDPETNRYDVQRMERMKRGLQQHIEDVKWNRLLTAVTIPFDPPKSSEVAVKVMDKAGMKTIHMLDITKGK